MLKQDCWWLFLLVFAVGILGIQSLGWWAHPAAAEPQTSVSKDDPLTSPAGLRYQRCQSKHWRTMVMQQ
jgi:hypothetical protein